MATAGVPDDGRAVLESGRANLLWLGVPYILLMGCHRPSGDSCVEQTTKKTGSSIMAEQGQCFWREEGLTSGWTTRDEDSLQASCAPHLARSRCGLVRVRPRASCPSIQNTGGLTDASCFTLPGGWLGGTSRPALAQPRFLLWFVIKASQCLCLYLIPRSPCAAFCGVNVKLTMQFLFETGVASATSAHPVGFSRFSTGSFTQGWPYKFGHRLRTSSSLRP